MTEIILVRHGETAWNANEVFRGQLDVELNETGQKQAELLAEFLSGLKLDTIYSSPLVRARKTAEPLAHRQQLEIQVSDGLIDLDFGAWQGLTPEEVSKKYPELYQLWIKNPQLVVMPGGESLGDVRERALGVVNGVLNQQQGTVVLVSHRVVNKVLICALLGLDDSHFWNIRQDTCGITRFTHEDSQFVLTEHNNTAFLSSLQMAKSRDF